MSANVKPCKCGNSHIDTTWNWLGWYVVCWECKHYGRVGVDLIEAMRNWDLEMMTKDVR